MKEGEKEKTLLFKQRSAKKKKKKKKKGASLAALRLRFSRILSSCDHKFHYASSPQGYDSFFSTPEKV